MSNDDDGRVRSGLRRYYRALGRVQKIPDSVLVHGRAARVLAAVKPGGQHLAVDCPELSFFLADGMDITSQLVSVLSGEDSRGALQSTLGDDIRVSVHCQHPLAFFGDVSDHRFDLMCFGDIDGPAADVAVARLAPGGLLAAFPGGAGNPELEPLLAARGLLVTPLIRGALVAARAPSHLKPKRRGGRGRRPRSQA